MEKIGEILLRKKIITEDVIKDVLVEQDLSLKKFGDILVQKGLIEENQLIEIVAEQNGYGFIDNFANANFINNKENFSEFCWRNCCALIKKNDRQIFVFNSNNAEISSYITSAILTNSVEIALSSKELIYRFLSQNVDVKIADSKEKDNLANEIFESLEIAIFKKSSNVRIKKSLESYSIQVDTDTGIETLKVFSLAHGERIINIIANLCKTQIKPRQSLEAKFSYISQLSKEKVDIRVEFLPVSSKTDDKGYFEAVLRIHGMNKLLDLKMLGFAENEILELNEILTYSSGLILSAGPTGAGKSTTFYAVLKELAKKRMPILTIEDPVEIKLNEINISQMSVDDNFRYENALTAMLRCEPKIILVGEIRDTETAGAVIKAAQTGHLVLSTIHTQSAVNVVPRIKGMGVGTDEFLEVIRLASSQRLYLPLCPNCRQKIDINTINKSWVKPLKRLGINEMDREVYIASRGKKCDLCFGSGYLSKKAVIEILPFTDNVISDIKLGNEVEYDTLKRKALGMFRTGIIDIGQLFNIAG